uniref:PHB domain-containing protein n=1 Tax=Schistosoma curassoni TaxID=6186 RepID=A0A183JWJ5_9TREM
LIGTDAFRKIQHLNKIYGDIVSFQVLGKTIIILYNYDLINEAANENRSKVGRYTMTVNDLLAENSGISNYDTPKALEMRRAVLRLIHNNIKTAEEHEGTKLHPIISQNIINAQINELIRQLRIRQGKPVNVFVNIFRHSQFARKLFDIEEILQKHRTVRQLIDSNVGDIYNSDSLLGQLINDSKLNLTTRESFKLKNYYIPKSSILIYNLYAVHNSQLKKLINTEQKSDEIQESDKPIPFSLGK